MNFSKNSLSTFYKAIYIALLFSSCQTEEENNPQQQQAWGIRHDKKLADYEQVATNKAPYNSSEYPNFSSVVFFQYSLNGSNSFDYQASGVLIAPNWILTAGHNFFYDKQKKAALPSGIKVIADSDPNQPTTKYEVEQLVFHPTWLDQNDDFFNTGNDLCLVKLKTPINSVSPAQLIENDEENLGSIVWYAGYGDYSQQLNQDANLISKRHALQNILDRKKTGLSSTVNSVNYQGGLLAFDFDDPQGLINTLGDSYSGEEENLLGSGSSASVALDFEGATVEGDSGGPLFIKSNGIWKVAAVLSGGVAEPVSGHKAGNYGDISVFTRTFPMLQWIKNTIK
jgi:V8-like Glu-specific endopeptidase